MFNRERRTVTIDGQDIVLVELSADDMARLMSIEDDNEQTREMLAASVESPAVTAADVGSWPSRIVTQILNESLGLNGLSSEGN